MTADTRPPLYLDQSDAVNWTRFHPEDIGREIIVTESPIKACPAVHLAAWKGYGRWERGLAGQWPVWTAFAWSFLEHPPAWATVALHNGAGDGPGTVTFRVQGQEVCYRIGLHEDDAEFKAVSDAFGSDYLIGFRI